MAEFFVQAAEDIKSLFQAKHMEYDFASEQAKVNDNPSNEDRIRYETRLLALLNYVDRIVNPIPRKVVFSETLSKKIASASFPGEILNEINRFKELFISGEDVNNHLSKTVFNPEKIDYAFNLWKIKHLHLNYDTTFEKNAMSQNRSDWLLFAIVKDDTAYFLDVRNHPSGAEFTAYSFFKIIADNGWLPIIGYSELVGVNELQCDENEIHTDKAIYELIKARINRPFKYDGKYYIGIFTGVTASGDSLCHVRLLSSLNNAISSNLSWEYKELVEISDLAGICLKFIDIKSGKEFWIALICNENQVRFFDKVVQFE